MIERTGDPTVSSLKLIAQHPLAAAIFLSPTVVLVGTSALADYACSLRYRLDPYQGILDALLCLLISSALMLLDKQLSIKLAGKNAPLGTRLFFFAGLGFVVNGLLSIPLLLAWRISFSMIGTPCGP